MAKFPVNWWHNGTQAIEKNFPDDIPAGGGGVAIGDAVTGGGNTRVLFIDGSGDLGSDAAFCWVTNQLIIGDQTFAGNVVYAEATGFYANTNGGDEGSSLQAARLDFFSDDFSASVVFAPLTGIVTINADGGTVFDGGAVTVSSQFKLGANNAVTAGVGVASTNRVKINVGGTDYYFLVTTVA